MIFKREKITLFVALVAMMLILPACGGDDEPEWNHDVEFNPTLLNHVWDNTADKACELTTAKNYVTFHRGNISVDLKLYPGAQELGNAMFELKGLDVTVEDYGLYSYKSATTSDPRITKLSFMVDFNEQAVTIYYTVDGRYDVVATMQEVFFLENSSTLTYDDASESVDASSIYQYTIDPASMTATMKVGPLTDTQIFLMFETIIARSIPVTVTRNGYELECPKPITVSVYRRIDSGAGTDTTTDAPDAEGHQKYPMTGMSSSISVVHGTHATHYTMGSVDEGTKPFGVEAAGKFYKTKKQ